MKSLETYCFKAFFVKVLTKGEEYYKKMKLRITSILKVSKLSYIVIDEKRKRIEDGYLLVWYHIFINLVFKYSELVYVGFACRQMIIP